MSGFRVQSGLECKTPGCDNSVLSHKGLAGWCAIPQPNGKTHRQEEIEARRARGEAGGNRHHPKAKKTKANDNGVIPTAIAEAYAKLALARRNLVEAQQEIISAEGDLRSLLEDELEKVNQ